MPIAQPSQDKLNALGVDWLCDQLADGAMMTAIAKKAGVNRRVMMEWIAADAKRAALVNEARIMAAASYEEKAEKALLDAKKGFDLMKAKELAHHYRWKASKLDPRRYGDKIAVGGADDLPPIKRYSDVQLAARIKALQQKVKDEQG